jgi:glutathione peroxidase-family protein/outer membrane protein assembly factor BamB
MIPRFKKRFIALIVFSMSMCTVAASFAQVANEKSEKGHGDWPMWGGTADRNMIATNKDVSLDFSFQDDKNVNWSMLTGSQTYGNPVVGSGKVLVGTNNGAGYRPKHPKDQDRGVILCFDEKTGELEWQLTRQKLEEGRVVDWPLQGICSTPIIEGNRMWVVSNRCELLCVDLEGFHDGENDGPYKEEDDVEELDADIIWRMDMFNDLNVFPHNLATSSPVIHEDLIFILTSNGVDEAHLEMPSPRSPSFIAVNKNTGELKWERNDPGSNVLHGQWSSPTVGIVNGRAQVYFGAGDAWVYACEPETGELIWKFDLNPKNTHWELGGAGTRNAVIGTPVFHENSVIVAVGQDPEHGEGVGHLWRIDATKTGDISAELGELGQPGEPNPDSGVIWHYGGVDDDGSVTGEAGEGIFWRTISTASVYNDRVFLADLSGRIHCVDWKSGKRIWVHDLLAGVWGSTLVVDDKIFIGNEDGVLTVLDATADSPKVIKKFDTKSYASIYSTPTFANGNMFITSRTRCYSIDVTPGDDNAKPDTPEPAKMKPEPVKQLTAKKGEEKPKALDFDMKTIAGDQVNLADKYKGKVVLVVNVASKCGLTPQYSGLQSLHKRFGSKGLAVLGFPCNQFGGQEPGSEAEIMEFCDANYGVEFDMFSKIDVNGNGSSDLYKHLTSLETKPQGPGKISWNFEKFLIGRDGKVIARFDPRTSPNDKELVKAIEAALAEK